MSTSTGAPGSSECPLSVGRPLLSCAELHTQAAGQPSQQLHNSQHKEDVRREMRDAQGFDRAVVRKGVHPASQW